MKPIHFWCHIIMSDMNSVTPGI